MTDEEAWTFLAASHTGVVTSLRKDGIPVPLPVWFAARDGAVYFSTPAGSKKVSRVRRDPRVSFLAEAGGAWKELQAVIVIGRASIVEDDAERRAALDAISEKYTSFK